MALSSHGDGPVKVKRGGLVYDIQIVGHVCVDLAPSLPGEANVTPGALTEVGPIQITIGGAVGNGATAAKALGRRAAVAAAVGIDELGRLLQASLEGDMPRSVFLEETSAATSYSVVVAPPGGDRSFWHHTGANDEFDGTCPLLPSPMVHFGYPTLCPGMTAEAGRPTVELFRRAHAQGSATSLDLAYCADNSTLRRYDWDAFFRSVLPQTDVFCPSWDDVTSARSLPAGFEASAVTSAADEFLGMGAGVVLITLGEQGSYLATGDDDAVRGLANALGVAVGSWSEIREWIPAAPVERFVSSNGAGDTFKTAFLLSAQGAASPVAAAKEAARIVARKISGRPLLENGS